MGKAIQNADPAPIVLCWDIETANTVVLGIGAALMDCATGDIVARALFKSYCPGMRLDARCWKEFWHDKQDILDTLAIPVNADGSRPGFEAAQSKMIHDLMAFFKLAEKYAVDNGREFHHVSDNRGFDVGLINTLIEKHYGRDAQLPRSPTEDPSTGEHEYLTNCFETQSMQRMLLLQYDPGFLRRSEWGYTDRIYELWGVPNPPAVHDHNPVNDAIFQLHAYRTLLQIASGQYTFQGVRAEISPPRAGSPPS